MANNRRKVIKKDDLGFMIHVHLPTPQGNLGNITITPLTDHKKEQNTRAKAEQYLQKIAAGLEAAGGSTEPAISTLGGQWWSLSMNATQSTNTGKGKTLIDVITAICDQIDNPGKTQTGHTSKTTPMMAQLKAKTARYRNLRAGFRGIINKYGLDQAFADETGTVVNQRTVREASDMQWKRKKNIYICIFDLCTVI